MRDQIKGARQAFSGFVVVKEEVIQKLIEASQELESEMFLDSAASHKLQIEVAKIHSEYIAQKQQWLDPEVCHECDTVPDEPWKNDTDRICNNCIDDWELHRNSKGE